MRQSVTFCFLNIVKSFLEFHQTLQTCSHLQDKYIKQKSKVYGPILLELFPFVVLNGFLIGVYAYAIILYLEESLLKFHQTLQTCSHIQDKYINKKVRARGQFY